jgi:hypothetical protein
MGTKLDCSVLEQALATKMVFNEAGQSRPLHSAIPREEGLFLQGIIRRHRPAPVLRLDVLMTSHRYLSAKRSARLGAREHVVIDPYQLGSGHDGPDDGYEGIGPLNLKRAGLHDLVTFYPEPSYLCLPRLAAEKRKFDFAFVDGMHTFDYVLVDFFFIDKMLNVGGVIVFDDLGYPSVLRACRYILTNLAYIAVGPPVAQLALKRKLVSILRIRQPSNAELGISRANWLALRKTADDRIGNGPSFTRHWADHSDF